MKRERVVEKGSELFIFWDIWVESLIKRLNKLVLNMQNIKQVGI